MVLDAGVPPTTAQAWRYGDEPVTPQSAHLLKILRAVGVLDEKFQLPEAGQAVDGEAEAAQLGRIVELLAELVARLERDVPESGDG